MFNVYFVYTSFSFLFSINVIICSVVIKVNDNINFELIPVVFKYTAGINCLVMYSSDKRIQE